jgi:hypothetical protein
MGVPLSRELRGQAGRAEVDLSRRELTKVPADIGRLRQCRSLNVSGNKLSTLPFETGAWRLCLCPPSVCGRWLDNMRALCPTAKLGALQLLDMSDNTFSSLPKAVPRLTKLTTLVARTAHTLTRTHRHTRAQAHMHSIESVCMSLTHSLSLSLCVHVCRPQPPLLLAAGP